MGFSVKSRPRSGVGLQIATVMIALLAGCATPSGIRNAPLDEGVQRLFRAPVEDVRTALKEALVETGFKVGEVAEVNDGVWIVVATKGMSLMSYGEIVRVILEDHGETKTVARFMTKRRLATNIAAKGDWSASIFEAVQTRLAIEDQ